MEPYRKPASIALRPTDALTPAQFRVISKPRFYLGRFAPLLAASAVLYGGLLAGYFIVAVAGLIGLAALLAVRLIRRRRGLAWVRRNDDAVALLSSGRLDDAAREFDRLIGAMRSWPVLHAMALHNRGAVCMRQGEIERAIEIVQAVDASGWLRSPALGFATNIATVLGMCHAIKNEVPIAERYLDEARRAASDSKRGTVLVLETLIALRKARWADAIDVVDHNWPAAEGVLGAPQLRSLRVLQAFARSCRGDTPDEVTAALARMNDPRPGESEYLAASWPELRDFLHRHGLS